MLEDNAKAQPTCCCKRLIFMNSIRFAALVHIYSYSKQSPLFQMTDQRAIHSNNTQKIIGMNETNIGTVKQICQDVLGILRQTYIQTGSPSQGRDRTTLLQ
jgi:hypothetical protein